MSGAKPEGAIGPGSLRRSILDRIKNASKSRNDRTPAELQREFYLQQTRLPSPCSLSRPLYVHTAEQ